MYLTLVCQRLSHLGPLSHQVFGLGTPYALCTNQANHLFITCHTIYFFCLQCMISSIYYSLSLLGIVFAICNRNTSPQFSSPTLCPFWAAFPTKRHESCNMQPSHATYIARDDPRLAYPMQYAKPAPTTPPYIEPSAHRPDRFAVVASLSRRHCATPPRWLGETSHHPINQQSRW